MTALRGPGRSARRGAWAGLFLCCALAAVARAEETPAANAGGTLTVFAASSLQEAFRALGTRFTAAGGTAVRFSFAGSQELRAQLEQGAQADLFASADLRHAEALQKSGLAGAPRSFAFNTLVIAVPKGNPARVKSLDDLARLEHLVVGAPEVPVGAYTEAIFARAEARTPGLAARLQKRISSREPNVRQVLAKVALGEADSGIVYRTDARALRDQVDAVELAPELAPRTEAVIATLAHAAHREAAEAFVAFLLSREGQAELAVQGFIPVAGP